MSTTTTAQNLGTVTLAGTTYTVEEFIHTDTETGTTSSDTYLNGPRGAAYFLRGFIGANNGLYQVISWKSGAPLRKHGNEIRVIRIGDILEQAPARPVRVH